MGRENDNEVSMLEGSQMPNMVESLFDSSELKWESHSVARGETHVQSCVEGNRIGSHMKKFLSPLGSV